MRGVGTVNSNFIKHFFFRMCKGMVTSPDTNEDLSYEESEKRLILLGLIFAFCSLILSTAFVIIILRLYGKFIDPLLISLNPKSSKFHGFPFPSVLMLSSTGNIIEFSYQPKVRIKGIQCAFSIWEQ